VIVAFQRKLFDEIRLAVVKPQAETADEGRKA
jgi:hypothetical protein